MLVRSNQSSRKRGKTLLLRTTTKKVSVFQFPAVKGLEDVSHKLNAIEAENLFVALLHVFDLRPIEDENTAKKAERVAEYIERAFVARAPQEVGYYSHLLHILIQEYDQKQYISATFELAPHEFLKALLDEEKASQKSLVPECFHSESQVSEFLHQKKGRERLSCEQAIALGKRFHVNPLTFLPRILTA